jgi:hypothetical protein
MAAVSILPIRDSVGAALRFTREHWRFALRVGAIGAGAATLLAALPLPASPLALLSFVPATLVQAFVCAAFVGAALLGSGPVAVRLLGDGGRVWAAMAVIGFFLFIVFFVLTMALAMALAMGPLAPYLPQLESAGQDQAAVMAVLTRFAEEQPGPLLLAGLALGLVWLLLTSRLYLAAPASVDQQRILAFETWSWTKGAMWRIAAARLMLLVPANILVGALSYVFGRMVGIDSMAPAAAGNVGGFLVYVFVAHFMALGFYAFLEAGLAVAIYRKLRPAG